MSERKTETKMSVFGKEKELWTNFTTDLFRVLLPGLLFQGGRMDKHAEEAAKADIKRLIISSMVLQSDYWLI